MWCHPAGEGGDGGVIFSRKGDYMAVNITWDYKSVQLQRGISSDVRQKILQHEAEEGWVYVGTVPIDDDDHLVFKKSSDRPGIAVIS
jgi:hypothetical protein